MSMISVALNIHIWAGTELCLQKMKKKIEKEREKEKEKGKRTRLKRIESMIARKYAPKATSQFSKCSKHSIV